MGGRLTALWLAAGLLLLTGCFGPLMNDPDSADFEQETRRYRNAVEAVNREYKARTGAGHKPPAIFWKDVVAVATVQAARSDQETDELDAGLVSETARLFVEEHEYTVERCPPAPAPGLQPLAVTPPAQSGTPQTRNCPKFREYYFTLNDLDTVMDQLKFDDDDKEMTRMLLEDCAEPGWEPRPPPGWHWPLVMRGQPKRLVPFAITTCIGPRVNPVNGNTDDFHNGIDIAPVQPWSEESQEVRAAFGGRITHVQYGIRDTSCGVEIVIGGGMLSPAETVMTRYCHLDSVVPGLTPGSEVDAGALIGWSGNSGTMTTGHHLHFEIHVNGRPQDPMGFYR